LQRIAWYLFVYPSVYKAFVTSVEGAKLRGFLKLSEEERSEYLNYPEVLVEDYLKDHPGVFQPLLQTMVRK
jgi:hypothetical protein